MSQSIQFENPPQSVDRLPISLNAADKSYSLTAANTTDAHKVDGLENGMV